MFEALTRQGKVLPRGFLSTGMLPLVFMKERTPHQPTSI